MKIIPEPFFKMRKILSFDRIINFLIYAALFLTVLSLVFRVSNNTAASSKPERSAESFMDTRVYYTNGHSKVYPVKMAEKYSIDVSPKLKKKIESGARTDIVVQLSEGRITITLFTDSDK
jgi:hypothetical protein